MLAISPTLTFVWISRTSNITDEAKLSLLLFLKNYILLDKNIITGISSSIQYRDNLIANIVEKSHGIGEKGPGFANKEGRGSKDCEDVRRQI